MRTKKELILIAIIIVIATTLSAQTGREIMEKVQDNQNPKSSAMDISMELIDKKGKVSSRRIQTLTKDDKGLKKTITLFLEPANIKNTRFLTVQNKDRGDDQWIYLPSLKKVKRIAAGDREGSFMGSDFSYADMSSHDLDDSDYKVLTKEKINGKECWVVESIPKPESDSLYGKVITWVDMESYVTLKVDFYGKDKNTKIKELTMDNIQKIDGYWSPQITKMTTLKTGHSTLLEYKQIKYDIPLKDGFFSVNFLRTGRP
jgi:hypothetical protein